MTDNSKLIQQHDYDVEKAKTFLKRDEYVVFTKEEFGSMKTKILMFIFVMIILTFVLSFVIGLLVGGSG